MNKKALAVMFALVAVAACLVLVFVTNAYRSTSFYLLGQGEESLCPRELFFFPASQSGQGYYVGSSGQWTPCERLNWEVVTEDGVQTVSFYRYGSRILCDRENALNFYGGNTLDRFVFVQGEKKYLAEISSGRVRPLFEGSAIDSPYAEGIEAISSDGGLCAGLEEGVLTFLTLEKSTFSPTEKRQISLADQGLEQAQILRFLNERHLWLTCEKDGQVSSYLCDGLTGETVRLASVPEGFGEERMSRVWRAGTTVDNEETHTLTLSFFNEILGTTNTVSLSSLEFEGITPVSISPNGEHAVLKLLRDGQEVWGCYRFESHKLTLMDQRPQRVDFASEQVMVLQTDTGYQAVRIVN